MGFMDRKPEEQIPESTSVERELKRAKFFGWRDVVVCLLIVGAFLLIRNTELGKTLGKNGFGGGYDGLSPVLEETQFGITGLDGVTHTFVYVDSDMELREGLKDFLDREKGERVAGEETKRVCSGLYHNEAFGDYQLHVQTRLNNYIVVHTGDGVIVFNLESDETTKELYKYFTQCREEQLAAKT